MAGRVKDLTKGTPWKIITLFSIPIAISYILQQLYNVFDLLMIGNLLPETSFAAVGTTTPLSLFFLMFATGCATGFSVVTSQRFGKGDYETMKLSFITGIILCVIIGFALTIISVGLCEPFLYLVGVDRNNALFIDAYNYIIVIFIGTIANIFYNYFACILRSVGNTRAPLIFLAITAVLNIGLNYMFLTCTDLGVIGPAIGTVVSQGISAIASFIYIQVRYPEFRVKLKEFRLEKRQVQLHLKQGLPMGVQFSFLYIALIILQRQINSFGEGATSAFSAANKVDALIMQPSNAIGTAMVTFVGQNYGSRKHKRIKEGIIQMSIVQAILCLIMTVVALCIKDNFIYIIVKDPSPDTVKYAPIVMLLIGLSQISIGAIFLFRNALQACNRSIHAMICSIIQAVIRIIIALTFPLFMGFLGVALATPIAWLASGISLIIMTIIHVFKRLPSVDQILEKDLKEQIQ